MCQALIPSHLYKVIQATAAGSSSCTKMNASYYITITFLLLYHADITFSKVRYYITSSSNDSCSGNFCLTLSQYAANYRNIKFETDVSLIFLPGNHVLDRKLSVSHKNKFIMKTNKDSRYAFVECNGSSGRLNIRKTEFALIKNIQFTGCKRNKVTQVARFVLNHTTFRNAEAKGQERAATYYSLTVGGALDIHRSNVWMVNSNFTNNSAGYGGTLHAQGSSIYMSDCFFGYNRATKGGVMGTSDSSVTVINCTFINNEADTSGGVMHSLQDLYSITDCSFNGNSAHASGVMDTYASIVSISNSSFINNSGTMTNSSFVNSSASHDSGAD